MSNYYGSIKKEHLLSALEDFKETTTEKIKYNKWRSFVKFVKEELNNSKFYRFDIEGNIKFTIYTGRGTSEVITGSKYLIDIILDWADNWNKVDDITAPDGTTLYKIATDVKMPVSATPDCCVNTLTKRVEDLEMKVKDTYVNDKENKTMDIMKNFEFGKLTNPAVRLSMYGIAVKNTSGTWVSYDTNTGNIIDVDVFNFDTGSFLYQMPVAVKQIKTGDTIIHNRKPCFVVGFAEDTGNPIVIDVMAGERKEVLPTKNMFGFNFVVKIVNLMTSMFGDMNPNVDNPFGSMLPFLMMGDNTKMDDILPMLMMNGNTMDNPMLMYAMMKGNGKDMLPFLMMSMYQGKNCGCHRQDNNE